MAKIDATLRRWCDTCQRVTRSWLASDLTERCAGCDPESRTQPGYGVRDLPEDGDW